MFRHTLTMTAVLALASSVAAGAQQARPAKAPALTPQDYMEIQQLSARYAFDIDTCVNAGADFADLFTDDGEFSVSQQWGVAGNRKTKGRGVDRCRRWRRTRRVQIQNNDGLRHQPIVVNHVITPAPDGAIGKSYSWRSVSAETRPIERRAATRTST